MKKYGSATLLCSLLVFSLVLAPTLTQGAVKTWTWTSGNSNWVNAANWSGGTVPVNYDDVFIANSTVILTNDTAMLNSLVLSNKAYLYVYSPPTNGATPWGLLVSVSGQVTIVSNSWIYPYSHPTNGGSAWFQCSNLMVDATSGFDASSRGFSNGTYLVNSSQGYGPGAPPAGSYGGMEPGAGYGGNGGSCYGGVGGTTYGSSAAPAQPGSGGPSTTWGSYASGGYGGGLIHVEAAETVIVDGSLLANGGNPSHSYGGAGSGGGIYIGCKRFKGAASGTLQAKGGDAPRGQFAPGGSGGGGRIAVIYNIGEQALVSPQPQVAFNAGGGENLWAPYFQMELEPSARQAGNTVNSTQAQGRPGSVYFTDNTFFDLARIQGGAIMVPGVTSWATNSLAISNGLVAFPSGFNLTLSQNLNLTGRGGLDLSNSVVSIGGDFIVNTDNKGGVYMRGGPNQQLSLGGNLSITQGRLDINLQGTTGTNLAIPGSVAVNAGNLLLHANPTNIGALTVAGGVSATNAAKIYLDSSKTNGVQDYGLLVAVSGNITIATNSWVYPYSHYTNGGSVLFRAANLTVNAGGGIDATAGGFAGAIYALTGIYSGNGFGPGRGYSSYGGTAYYSGGGGGYGGAGGHGGEAPAVGGSTYGSSNAPVDPGSGGGAAQVSGWGGYGGGLIRVEAGDTVIVDGSLLANGGPPVANNYVGPGSGGAIFIKCKYFKGSGNGQLQANGRNATSGGNGNGGSGGGRIAVWYTKSTNQWFGAAQVSGGALGGNTNSYPLLSNGSDGTIVWFQVPPPRGTTLYMK